MEELIPIVAIFFVIGVPVMSIAARFVLRPLLRDFAQVLGRGKGDQDVVAELTQRLSRMETHLLEQDRRLDHLVDAELFRRQLEERTAGAARLSSRASIEEPDRPGWSGSGH